MPLALGRNRITSPLHTISLREWDARVLPGLELSAAARRRLDSMDLPDGMKITETREGLSVESSSWVGVLRLEEVEIRIHPKFAGSEIDLVRLLERVADSSDFHWHKEIVESRMGPTPNLRNLLVMLFAEEVERVIRRGLVQDYAEREEWSPVVRGKLRPDRQYFERFGRLDRLACVFDEPTKDLPENQLLVDTVQCAWRFCDDAVLRRRLARLRDLLEPVASSVGVDFRGLRNSIRYHRMNKHYRLAHELAWLIRDAHGFDDLLSSGSGYSYSFLIDMNRVFERFVEVVVGAAADDLGFAIVRQSQRGSVIRYARDGSDYAKLVPDVLVSRGADGGRVPVDAKYKPYDDKKLAAADIYQTFVYAFGLSEVNSHDRIPRAIVLYPSSRGLSSKTGLEIHRVPGQPAASITALALPIPALLDDLERRDLRSPLWSNLREVLA